MKCRWLSFLALCVALTWAGQLSANRAAADDVVRPASQRFAADTDEVPNFRRHVVPLLGRLGCNGRACHGSFQGQGGFRLSLFGYDFDFDQKNMLGTGDEGEPRVNLDKPAESLALQKPTMQVEHAGGQRMKAGSWQYRVLHRWIEGGAKSVAQDGPKFQSLTVIPDEIVYHNTGEQTQLKVIVNWSDGSHEDVTCLCRFKSNSDQVATVDEDGLITAKEPGDTHVVVFYDNGVQPIPVIRPVSDKVGPKYPSVPTPTKIDELVVQKLRKLGVVPSDLTDDAEFLRRVSLDITGTLPPPEEVKAFLGDKSADKRAKKIDELLERPGYVAWWTTRLCDITGNNDNALNNVTPVRASASQQWYDWIKKRVAENTPYDELAAGIVLATSREKDEDFLKYCQNMSKIYAEDDMSGIADRESMPHYWARRTFRQPEERVIGFAYTFLGLRIQCAQCHKHPFDQWTKQDFEDFKGFFTQVAFGTNRESKEEYDKLTNELGLKGKRGNDVRRSLPTLLKEGKVVPFQEVYLNPIRSAPRGKGNNRRNAPRSSATARVLGGEKIDLTKYTDAREPLMKWLRSKDNPYFARAFVNRVWAGYFNIGIVNPPDDLSLANPPSNRPLLDYLTQGFIDSGYDMKWLHREIANSRTYQLSWRPNDTNKLDETNFSHAVPRRLPAEVAYDCLQQATASDAAAEKIVSEVDDRAIAIPGSGRRNNNRGPAYALTIFGRSIRESNCDCDRSSEASLLQTVFLQNDSETLQLIDRRGGWLDQVARALGKSVNSAVSDPQTRRPGNYEQQLKALRQRLVQARKSGNDKLVKAMQERLKQYTRRFGRDAKPERKPREAEVAASSKPMNDKQIVEQAYLRTLSRYPTDDEIERSLEYVNGGDDKVNGVRGLLWALINTKEFIVNH